ncbi:MAG: hypothetical protein ACJAZP_003109 [Psychromonas sp.]|jgi:hypothetical protein|uniref:hypothetical protein n=1 Tax=Psychromonas sp. TaxID=1884585 RepID=UPI0039E325A5
MKFFTFIFTLLLSTQAFAHEDHALGEGSLHLIYHVIFWGLCAVVAVKAMGYFKNKKKTEK